MFAATRRLVNSRPASALAGLCVAVALALSLIGAVEVRRQSDCVAQWGDRYTARVNRITDANNQHNQATDSLIVATNAVLIDAINKQMAELTRDIPRYKTAVTEYQSAARMLTAAQKANPVPASPRLRC